MTPPPSFDFNKFWFSRSVSVFGSQISVVALPLLAVLTLEATPAQMGWLNALQQLPMAFFGLMAGVWVDRARRRPMLVVTNLAQGVLVAAIPLAAYGGWLSLPLVYVVAFAANSFRVVEGVAERAYLPSILPKERLLEGNSKIWFSYSLSQTVGPGIAGGLVTTIGAPFALALDALSYFVSGASIASIRGREPRAAPAEKRARTDVRLGLQHLARDPVLRPLVLCGGMHNVFTVMLMTIYFIYLARELALAPYVLGVILAAGGVGAIVGSVVARRLVGRLGSPRTLIPTESMGRVNASIAFVLWAFTPFGALAAAAVSERVGPRGALWVSAIGVLLATAWLLPRGFLAAGTSANSAVRV